MVKMNSTGSAPSYSTFSGRSNADTDWSITVDSSGNTYIMGQVDSRGFPTTSGVHDKIHNEDGDALIHSTS